jgi:hypothetical protein
VFSLDEMTVGTSRPALQILVDRTCNWPQPRRVYSWKPFHPRFESAWLEAPLRHPTGLSPATPVPSPPPAPSAPLPPRRPPTSCGLVLALASARLPACVTINHTRSSRTPSAGRDQLPWTHD